MKLNRKGQNSFVEYATTFFLVVSIITTMGTYVRRLLQGRTRDALHYMASTVQTDYTGTFYFQYEPYYSNSMTTRYVQNVDTMTEQGAYPLGAGIVEQLFNHQISAITNQTQLPPALAD
jgi:hypothetical protein